MVATKVRVGHILIIDGQLARVVRIDHITPGNWNAYVQLKMKGVLTGQNIERRVRSYEQVDQATLEQKKVDYLYKDNEGFHFMDTENYETITLPEEFIGDNKFFLKENMSVQIEYYEEQPLGVMLPLTVDLKVIETSPEIKNATATDSRKPATLETGLVVNVPPFIKEGEMIKVSTDTQEYLERTK